MTIAETANWVYMLSGHTHPKRRSGISHGHPTSPPTQLNCQSFSINRKQARMRGDWGWRIWGNDVRSADEIDGEIASAVI